MSALTATVEPPARRRLSPPARRLAAFAAAVLASLCVARYGLTGRALVGAMLVAALAPLTMFDLQHRVLPNRIVLPAAAAVLIAQIASSPDRTLEWGVAALGAAAFLLVPALVYPAGLGLGDVKLALLLGAALGWAILPALLLGLILSALFAVALLVRYGAAARKREYPLGPFLALGTVLVFFAS